MFGLSVHTTAIILTIVLAVIALGYLLFGWLRKRSWRVMWRGAGFILIPIGLLIMGLMDKVVDGINAVVNWANATYMTTIVLTGLIVGGVGVVLYLVGSFVPHVSGEEATKRRTDIRERKLAALRAPGQAAGKPIAPAQPSSQTVKLPDGPTPPPSPKAAASSAPATPDDKEIDDILKRHGIN